MAKPTRAQILKRIKKIQEYLIVDKNSDSKDFLEKELCNLRQELYSINEKKRKK